jgi:hypothetical protein
MRFFYLIRTTGLFNYLCLVGITRFIEKKVYKVLDYFTLTIIYIYGFGLTYNKIILKYFKPFTINILTPKI